MTAGWGQPGSQELGASLDTGSFLGPRSLLWHMVLGCDDPAAPRSPGPVGAAHRYCCLVSHRPALVSRSLVASTRTMLMKRMKLSCGSEGGLHLSCSPGGWR